MILSKVFKYLTFAMHNHIQFVNETWISLIFTWCKLCFFSAQDRNHEAFSWTANSWLFPVAASGLRFDLITSAPSLLACATLSTFLINTPLASVILSSIHFHFRFPVSCRVRTFTERFPDFSMSWRTEYARVINFLTHCNYITFRERTFLLTCSFLSRERFDASYRRRRGNDDDYA